MTVTKTADTNDSFCDPDDCSLRVAISEANSDGAPDVISFVPGLSGSIVLDSTLGCLTIQDEPGVSNDVSINGPGAGALSVSGNGAVRPFSVVSGANATIGKISIINGNATNVSGFGGGIRNQGTLTLNDSTVSGNKADAWSGGVLNLGTLTLNRSTVSGNEASDGGGIANTGALTLNDSTASGNKADAHGGGIYQANPSSPSTITNSTISGNWASYGCGIDNHEGLTRIENSTTTNNTAAISGSGVASTGDNSASTEIFSYSFTSDGYNLIGGGLTTAFNQTGDRFGVTSPGLDPLANNGGLT